MIELKEIHEDLPEFKEPTDDELGKMLKAIAIALVTTIVVGVFLILIFT